MGQATKGHYVVKILVKVVQLTKKNWPFSKFDEHLTLKQINTYFKKGFSSGDVSKYFVLK